MLLQKQNGVSQAKKSCCQRVSHEYRLVSGLEEESPERFVQREDAIDCESSIVSAEGLGRKMVLYVDRRKAEEKLNGRRIESEAAVRRQSCFRRSLPESEMMRGLEHPISTVVRSLRLLVLLCSSAAG